MESSLLSVTLNQINWCSSEEGGSLDVFNIRLLMYVPKYLIPDVSDLLVVV